MPTGEPRPVTSIFVASPGLRTEPAGDSGLRPTARVVLVDPRPERREVMRLLVDRCEALTVVGLAGCVAEAEAQIQAQQANVVLIEIQMPVPDGLATIATLRSGFPQLLIVVCSFHNDAATRDAAAAQGADGYLDKPLRIADLLDLVARPACSAGTAEPGNPVAGSS